MEVIIKEKLDSYLELLDEIQEKTEDERTAMALLSEISKDRRMDVIREERENKNGELATEKQKNLMKKLGIKFPEKVSKKEASVLIDEEFGNSR